QELTAALSDARQPLSSEQRRVVESWLSWMRTSLGRVTISVAPAHATLTLDGQALVEHETLLQPGAHRLLASSEGFVAHETTFELSAGQQMPLQVELKPHPVVAVREAPLRIDLPLQRAAPETDLARWYWIGGAGIGAIAAGATLFAFGLHDIARVEDAKVGSWRADLEPAKERAPWLTGVGIGLASVGLAGLSVATLALWLERDAPEGVSCAGTLSSVSCAVEGRF
ncbi:MAG TPA: hypothetical protein VMF89_28410, partial [Polyangiales bacterium]|nr:hypothetical protein [Polyangiales bacterium]